MRLGAGVWTSIPCFQDHPTALCGVSKLKHTCPSSRPEMWSASLMECSAKMFFCELWALVDWANGCFLFLPLDKAMIGEFNPFTLNIINVINNIINVRIYFCHFSIFFFHMSTFFWFQFLLNW